MGCLSYAPYGSRGMVVRVEVDIRRGIPAVDITGLAEGAVREARERVRAACRNSGFPFPQDRILINLAPAGIRKEGAGLDLALALAVLGASGLAPPAGDILAVGELELSGAVRPVRGALAAVAAGLEGGAAGFLVPEGNGAEAALLAPRSVVPVATLADAVAALTYRRDLGRLPITPGHDPSVPRLSPSPARPRGDLSEVRGQEKAKRALELAAAGGHNVLLFGPPGSGKTMLVRRLPTILPPLDRGEAIEAARLRGLAGQGSDGAALDVSPPFRCPHHSASAEGILGGGRSVRPGEITLAHLGVLFLDEAPEFRSDVLRALREPLQDGVISIARAEGGLSLPAEFQLVLAANRCPCGRLGGRGAPCLCAPDVVERYWRRLGGSLLDRVEIRVPMAPPDAGVVTSPPGEPSSAVAARVAAALTAQRERLRGTGIRRNARMDGELIDRYCPLDGPSMRLLAGEATRLALSGRALHGVLRVARTAADLAGEAGIREEHLAEALSFRSSGDDPWS